MTDRNLSSRLFCSPWFSRSSVAAVLIALACGIPATMAQDQRVLNLGAPAPTAPASQNNAAQNNATQDSRVLTMEASAAQPYSAGGTPIAIPPPTTEMVDVGSGNLGYLEPMVPLSNRLVAGFVRNDDLPLIQKGRLGFTEYAMVEVSRSAEFKDLTASDFKQLAGTLDQGLGKILNSSLKESESEFNSRMKSLHLDDAHLTIDKPVQLGCLFSKPDAYGFGMVVPYSMKGTNIRVAIGADVIRAKDRLLFLYVYVAYKDQESLKWMRKTSQDWADAVLKANAQ